MYLASGNGDIEPVEQMEASDNTPYPREQQNPAENNEQIRAAGRHMRRRQDIVGRVHYKLVRESVICNLGRLRGQLEKPYNLKNRSKKLFFDMAGNEPWNA